MDENKTRRNVATKTGDVKIKSTDIQKVRNDLLEKQNWICPVCNQTLQYTLTRNIVVDHDHNTGYVRAAMHRGCNRAEGSIFKSAQKWGKATNLQEVIKVLENLIAFWKLHSRPQTNLIYYNHKTPKQKQEAAKKKTAKKQAAKKKPKATKRGIK